MEWTDKISVFNEDCMSTMARYDDGYFDLAIVDPPYGLKKSSTKGSGKLKSRKLNTSNMDWDVAPNEMYFEELKRVSKHQIIWGGNYFSLPPTRCVLVWDKMQPWENFSQVEIAWTSFNSPAQIFKLDNKTGNKIHPTQKPIKLYSWLLQKYATSEFKIIDTHLGSGTNAIACDMFGCNLIACEINKRHYEDAKNEFDLITAQKRLF